MNARDLPLIVFLILAATRLALAAPDRTEVETARRRDGLHVEVLVDLPFHSVSDGGLTLFGGGVAARHGWWVVEAGFRRGSHLDGGGGSLADVRAGALIGHYAGWGAVRVGLTGGYAHAAWERKHEYVGATADLHGLGGELGLGYLAPFGLEVRAAFGTYGVVGGAYEGDEDAGGRPARLTVAGIRLGYEV